MVVWGCKDNFPPKENQILEGAFANYTQVFTADDRNDAPDVLTVVTGLRRRTGWRPLGRTTWSSKKSTTQTVCPISTSTRTGTSFFRPRGTISILKPSLWTTNEGSEALGSLHDHRQ